MRAELGLGVHTTFFPVPSIKDRRKLPFELRGCDLSSEESFTEALYALLRIGQGFMRGISPPRRVRLCPGGYRRLDFVPILSHFF